MGKAKCGWTLAAKHAGKKVYFIVADLTWLFAASPNDKLWVYDTVDGHEGAPNEVRKGDLTDWSIELY